jgi:hypothetical protein
MIGAALVFCNPTKCGLPRARGVGAPTDACAATLKSAPGPNRPRKECSQGVCPWWVPLAHPENSQRFFIFQCTTRGTKHHGLVEVASAGQSPLTRAQSFWLLWACCFPGRRPQRRHRAQPPLVWGTTNNKWTSCHYNIMPKQRRYMCFNLVFVLKSILS